MKKLYSLILIFISLSAASQNFLPFHKDRPAYYNFNSDKIFYTQAGISIDSFKAFGGDTVFYHYPIIDYDNSIYGCYLKAHDTSFVGDHSIRLTNGDDEFFNRAGDTIYFKNDATLNDSWTILSLGGGNKMVATVQSISVKSVLGTNDSVKTISLQAKDSLGNNISNIFNNKTYMIGKSMGFVSGYSLFHFPNDTIAFSLVGIENPSLGLSSENLIPEKIFDFDVGDEFDHISGVNSWPGYVSQSYSKSKILSKEVSADGDTITYEGHGMIFNQYWNFGDYSSSISSGTGTYYYTLHEYQFLKYKSFEFVDTNYWSGSFVYRSSVYPISETVKSSNALGAFQIDPDDCLQSLVADCIQENKYVTGLGLAYSYCGESNFNNHFDTLVYYNKNGTEWGDSIDWNTVTGLQEPSFQFFSIFPNPVQDQLSFIGSFTSSTEIHLLNLFGEEVKSVNVGRSTSQLVIDVSDLPEGVYLLKINSGEEVFTQKVVRN